MDIALFGTLEKKILNEDHDALEWYEHPIQWQRAQ